MAITNLRNRPVATEYATEQASRGTGQMGSVLDYLKTSDPTSYFYQKLKSEKNEFLRDDFWTEAAKRGESESMINLLQGTKKDTFSREALDAVSGYGSMMDYDTYMLALQLPHLDNTKKKPRTTILPDGTEYSFGDFTDQEYAWEILNRATQRWDAEIIEADKESRWFLSNVIAPGVGLTTNFVAGAASFVGDVWNVMEGAMYALGDWSNREKAFLEAFDNDDAYVNVFGNFGDWLGNASFELQRQYGATVNAVKAFDEGYELGEGNWIQQIDNAAGVGAGYTPVGKWLNLAANAIGYMFPTTIVGKMTLGASVAAKAAGKAASVGLRVASAVHKVRSGIFYAGIFSGMVQDEVRTGISNGYTLDELARGNIIEKSILKAGVQWCIEKALGAILGFSFTDKMIGTAGKATAKGAAKAAQVATKTGWAAAPAVLGRLAKDAGKEALEETLQELSDNLIDYGFTHGKLGLDISMETLTDAFIVGAMTSVVMGGFSTLSAVLPSNRGIALDKDGKAFTMGTFQTLNYRQAISQLNDIKTKAMDPKTNIQERANSLLTMNAAINTLGTIYQNFGKDRAIAAETVLTKLATQLDKKDALSKITKQSKYADKLWSDFIVTQQYAKGKYITQLQAEAIKRAAAKNAKLKEANVDKIESVVTTTTNSKDPDIGIEEGSLNNIVTSLKSRFGVDVIVGVNSNIVTTSDDILFVDQVLIDGGDINAIIKGQAYEAATETVKANLAKGDKDLLVRAYNYATGTTGNIDQAVAALLFDKTFYTYVLLKNNERKGAIAKDKVFNMLATVDKLIRQKVTPNLTPGSTADKAYKVLMKKVQKTMQTGLVTYATQYGMVDLDNVSTEILPAELRHDIENHRNVIYTKMINNGLKTVENIDILSKQLADYDNAINRFVTSQGQEQINSLKRKARSKSSDERFDAYVSLNILNRLAIGLEGKTIYLPSSILNIDLAKSLDNIKAQFGTTWTDILLGNINYLQMSKEIKDSIDANGYNLSLRSHRLTMLRTMLYNNSKKQFTISENGQLLQIIDKDTFILNKYLDELNLQTDLVNNKIKTLQDISKIPLDNRIGKIKIIMDSSMLSPGTNGAYNHSTKTIILSETNMSVSDTILHEATHGTQYIMDDLQKNEKDTVRTIGGTENIFKNLPSNVANDIQQYIKDRYPMAYNILTNGGNQGDSVHYMYYMLDGELRANAFVSSPLFETGFKWQGNNKYAPDKLVSPSGDKIWNMSKSIKKDTKPKQTLKEVETPLDFSESITIPRYVSKASAGNTNLKHFIGRQVHVDVQSFVKATTTNFDKLPLILKNQITNGTLNYYSLLQYVATAKRINDYTFKMIAEHMFNNGQVAQLTFKDMQEVFENIEQYAALSYVIDDKNENMTVKEMQSKLQEAYQNKNLEKELEKAERRVQVVKVTKTTGRGKPGSSATELGSYVESHADTSQLTGVFMRHFDGTLESVRRINAFGKYMSVNQNELDTFVDASENEEGEATSKTTGRVAQWNWVDRLRKAEIDYESDTDVTEALDNVDNVTKVKVISNYLADIISTKLESLSIEQRKQQATNAMRRLRSEIAKINELSESDLNQRYLAVLANETTPPNEQKITGIIEPSKKQKTPLEERSIKSLKDQIGGQSKIITQRILNLKRRYNQLSDIIKANFDSETFQLNDNYKTMTQPQLVKLTRAITEAKSQLNSIIKDTEKQKKRTAIEAERLNKLAKKLAEKEAKLKGKDVDPTKGKTLREKVNVIHTTKVINQNFEFDSREEITNHAKELLNTQWGKQAMSKVQGLTNNQQQNIHNGKTFFEANNTLLMGMSTADAEATARWFMDANMVGVSADSAEAQTYAAVKMYFLGYVFSETKDGGQFYGFNANLKNRLENSLKTQVTVAGTALAVWNNLQSRINPIETMMSASMAINGVELTSAEKDSLMKAAVSGDIDAINEAQKKIIERIGNEKTSKKGILRKITTVRSMAMLTSPITWLRNIISNTMLKRLNKLSTKIGNKVFVSNTSNSQFKMNGKVTPEIQNFINEHFVDNKLFDTLVSNLGKYNPSDIQKQFKDNTGKASKDAIFANMVIKSMYNQYYNENMFDKPWLNKTHQALMKMLSDNNWVREASIRYFGKIIAERGYSLDNGVTDAIMNDFAVAIGLGTADYMHSDNMFNKVESLLAEKSESLLFAYKLMLPFASAQWNWFKAAVRYSPIGLVNSIHKLTTLENQITKAEGEWAKGNAQVTPELTEFLIRRDLGSGIIGTSALIFGAILAALGYVDLEEDDYGTPKLNVGSLSIDVSTIFGSSSVLAGMALVKGWQENGVMREGIDAMLDPLLDGLFLTQILELDQYNNGGWGSFGIKYLEQTLLSFLPNGLRWLSGATYSGTYKTNNFFERAVARIPFFGSVFGVNKKVNPYTGDTGDFWDAFNRVVPFLEVRKTSAIEDESKALGINKTQLRGKYEVNGEPFQLSAKDTAELNKAYGNWNAITLTEFYNNTSRHSVLMDNNTYRTLTYNQMTEIQRRRTVNNIMTKNAEYAKIQAWLKAGNKYYASGTDFAKLRQLGITGNLFKGTKGFISK